VTLVSAGTAAILFGHAQAGVGARDSDEIIRTAPETFVDLNAQAPVPAAPTQKAETAAAPTPAPPLPIEAAETTARVMTEWAGPRLAQASETVAKYEPKVAVKFAQTQAGENRAKVTLALGSNRSGDVLDTLAHKVGYHANPRAAFGDRGRWYLFAATSNDAVGYNLLQGIQGQVHRAGFSSDRIAAATGDKQAGLAWRRGQLQASLAYVERELSTFGMSAQQRFVALTISLKGWGRPERAPQRASRWAPYEPAWQDQATEKDRRLSR
jgi:hypothetical protein